MSDELKASVTTQRPGYYGYPEAEQKGKIELPTGTKCRIISISTKYLTLELEEPTSLQQGETVRVSKA